jgi:hypothetical protein
MEPTNPANPYAAPANSYAPPKAELDITPSYFQTASLKNAREGRYDFRIGEVMVEAWRLVKGIKVSFWCAAAVISVIYLVLNTIVSIALVSVIGDVPSLFVRSYFTTLMGLVMTPFTTGLYMMGVRRALGAPVSFSTPFSYLSRSGSIIRGYSLIILASSLGIVLLLNAIVYLRAYPLIVLGSWLGLLPMVLLFIYLTIGYSLVPQLICDQELSAWRALGTSRRAINHRWWGVFGLWLVVTLITILSALVIVPLIWTLPWMCTVYGVLYRRIFFAGPPPEMPAASVSPAGPPPV